MFIQDLPFEQALPCYTCFFQGEEEDEEQQPVSQPKETNNDFGNLDDTRTESDTTIIDSESVKNSGTYGSI